MKIHVRRNGVSLHRLALKHLSANGSCDLMDSHQLGIYLFSVGIGREGTTASRTRIIPFTVNSYLEQLTRMAVAT